MRNSSDPRIPVVFGGSAGPTDAVLAEAGLPAPPGAHVFAAAAHAAGCPCCAPRSGVAAALGQLYRDRATSQVPFFSRVVVTATAAGQLALRHTLATDVLCQARYRIEG